MLWFVLRHPFKVTHGGIRFWGINKWDYVELKNTDIQFLRLQNCPIRKWEQNHNLLDQQCMFFSILQCGQILIAAQIISTICSNASNVRLFYHNFHNPKDSQGGNANSHLIFLGTNISFSALLNPWFSKVAYVVPVVLVRKHRPWWFAAHPGPILGTSGYGCPVAALTTTEPKPSCEGNVDFWSKRKMVPWTKSPVRFTDWGPKMGWMVEYFRIPSQ